MSTPPPTGELPQPPPQALHYALAGAQQVQIHQIGEDGQVQVVCALLISLPPEGMRGGGWGWGRGTASGEGHAPWPLRLLCMCYPGGRRLLRGSGSSTVPILACPAVRCRCPVDIFSVQKHGTLSLREEQVISFWCPERKGVAFSPA